MNIQEACPELGPNQIKMLYRLMLECVSKKKQQPIKYYDKVEQDNVRAYPTEFQHGYNQAIDQALQAVDRFKDELSKKLKAQLGENNE